MQLEATTNLASFNRIIADPEIWDRIAEDGQTREEMILPKDWKVIEVTTPKGLIGIFLLHPVESWEWQIHANILKRFRHRYAGQAGRGIMKWMAQNLPDEVRWVRAEIAVIYPDVMKFTKSHGFKDVGEIGPFMKDGREVETRLLIVAREEIDKCLLLLQ